MIPQTSNEVIQGFLEPGRSSERKQFAANVELRTSWKFCPQNRLAVEGRSTECLQVRWWHIEDPELVSDHASQRVRTQTAHGEGCCEA